MADSMEDAVESALQKQRKRLTSMRSNQEEENLAEVVKSLLEPRKRNRPNTSSCTRQYDASGTMLPAISSTSRNRSARLNTTIPGPFCHSDLTSDLTDQLDSSAHYSFQSAGEEPPQDDYDCHTFDDEINILEAEGTCYVSSSMSWKERMENRESLWEASRKNIFENVLTSKALPHNTLCFMCGTEPSIVICHECGSRYCSHCDRNVHGRGNFHVNRLFWTGKFFKCLTPNQLVNDEGMVYESELYLPMFPPLKCIHCDTNNGSFKPVRSNKKILVSLNGRFDVCAPDYICDCCGETSQADIEQSNMWRGDCSDQTTYLFEQDLFVFYDLLRKNEPGMSELGFIRTLEQFSQKKERVPVINRSIFSKAFTEWRYCQLKINNENCTDNFTCPACYPIPHSIHVDGNRKLYRYSRVSRGISESYYSGTFIVPNSLVDSHLQSIGYQTDVQESDRGLCGTTRWKAAKNKSKNMATLDETGLEVACCRHGLGLKAVNMFRGEIFGYPHYLHTQVFPSVAYLWEDVICQYWPWAIDKASCTHSSLDSTPCLSVMHAKAHIWQCQVRWDGRYQQGAAYSSGEYVEQFFSYLSRYSWTTKYMSASTREDYLTEAASFWNERKIANLPGFLTKHLQRIEKEKEDANKELKILEETVGFTITDDFYRETRQELLSLAEVTTLSIPLSPRDNDLLNYFKLESYINIATSIHCDQLADIVLDINVHNISNETTVIEGKKEELERLKIKLLAMGERDDTLHTKAREVAYSTAKRGLEDNIEILFYSIQKRLKEIATLAVSSKQRCKLREANTKDKGKMSQFVKNYNEVICPNPLVVVDDCLQGMFSWCVSDIEENFNIPIRLKLKILYTKARNDRLLEEMSLVKKEMDNLLKYYSIHLVTLIERKIRALEQDENEQSLIDLGKKAILYKSLENAKLATKEILANAHGSSLNNDAEETLQ